MLLLRMAVGGGAPLRGVLDPAGGTAYWKAAFPSAFIGGAVGIQEVLAIASESKRKRTVNMKPHRIKLCLSVWKSPRKRQHSVLWV